MASELPSACFSQAAGRRIDTSGVLREQKNGRRCARSDESNRPSTGNRSICTDGKASLDEVTRFEER